MLAGSGWSVLEGSPEEGAAYVDWAAGHDRRIVELNCLGPFDAGVPANFTYPRTLHALRVYATIFVSSFLKSPAI